MLPQRAAIFTIASNNEQLKQNLDNISKLFWKVILDNSVYYTIIEEAFKLTAQILIQKSLKIISNTC